MTQTDKSIQFTSHRVEVANEYEIGERVVFQGEGEIVGSKTASVGKDGECSVTYRVMPILCEYKASEREGITDVGYTKADSPSKRLRSSLFVLWSQQYQNKYPDFENYYSAAIEKLISDTKARLI